VAYKSINKMFFQLDAIVTRVCPEHPNPADYQRL